MKIDCPRKLRGAGGRTFRNVFRVPFEPAIEPTPVRGVVSPVFSFTLGS